MAHESLAAGTARVTPQILTAMPPPLAAAVAATMQEQHAISLLETGSTPGNSVLANAKLRGDLKRVQRWWDCACEVLRRGTDDHRLPVEDAQAVLRACIDMASLMLRVDARELPIQDYEQGAGSYWASFQHLEQGRYLDGRMRTRPVL